MNEVIELSKNNIVKKSERLILSRYQLNPMALKLVSALIASMKTSDENDKEYIFHVKEFKELLGTSSNRIYELLDEATEELLSKPIKIPTENRKGFKKFNWVSKAEYVYGEGLIKFRVDRDLRPYLIEAKERYLRYNIENIMKLKSTYSIRFYEILRDLVNKSSRYGKTNKHSLTIDWIRTTLEIPVSYRYNDIKRVVEKVQKELYKNSDISFSFEEVKEGRKVVLLEFIVEKKD